MNDATFNLVLMTLGPVAFLLIEGFKIISKAQGKTLTSTVKLQVTLVVSFLLGTIAGLASGQLDLGPILDGIGALSAGEPAALFSAIWTLIQNMIVFTGVVTTLGQATYRILKERLKTGELLSYRP